MLNNIAAKIFGSRNERLIKQYRKTVSKINAFELQMQALDDDALSNSASAWARAKRWTSSCRKRLLWCAKRASVYSACAITTYR